VLSDVYTVVSGKLDALSVARNMFLSNALTAKELQSVQSKSDEPVSAAEQLLNIIINKSVNVYGCFLEALKKTDQQDVFDVVIYNSYKGTSSSSPAT